MICYLCTLVQRIKRRKCKITADSQYERKTRLLGCQVWAPEHCTRGKLPILLPSSCICLIMIYCTLKRTCIFSKKTVNFSKRISNDCGLNDSSYLNVILVYIRIILFHNKINSIIVFQVSHMYQTHATDDRVFIEIWNLLLIAILNIY